jgi:hypothetical protein
MKKEILILVLFFITCKVYAQSSVTAEEAANHIGKTITICGTVSGARYLESSVTKPTLINVGGEFPNHALTILIRDEDRKNFPFMPEDRYNNKNICVTGTVIDYKGKPEIVVSTPSAIVLTDDNASLITSKESRKNVVTGKKELKNLTTTSEKTTSVKPVKKDTSSPGAKVAGSTYAIELTSNVNLREGPSTEDRILTVVKAGSVVNIFRSGNGWSYVSLKQDDDSEMVYGFIKNSVLK